MGLALFNWFRRALGKNEEPSQPEDVAPQPESTPESPPSEPTPPQPPESSEPAAAPEASKPDYLAWAKAAFRNIQARQGETDAPPLEEAVPPTPSPSAEEVLPVEPLPTPGLESMPTSEAHAVADPPPASPPSVLTETPPPPEPTGLSAPETIALDEGFLWSAEVLAAQGRRPEEVDLEEITWLQKLRQGLGKTRRGLVNQLKAVVGKGPLGAEAIEDIESLLLQADVGVMATDKIIQALQTKIRQDALPADQALDYLKQILRDVLEEPFTQGYEPNFAPKKNQLNIWLMTGVNGVGKTTTIGKIAHVASTSGYPCLVAAADTFRAAAVEQVKIWAARSGVEVVANPGQNTDPAAVVFDGISAAQARNCELLLIDTAGRLQNKQNLMDELKKIRRIVDKKAPDAHIESLLVLDASLGQNGLRQAQVFAEAAQLTGVVITKLDGTAKGGVALAVVQELGLPIRFVGAGEGIKDLRPFSSYEFVEALLSG